MADRSHYEAVLADLILRRDEINSAIAALQRQMSSTIVQPTTLGGMYAIETFTPPAQPTLYKELTINQAAERFLRSIMRDQPINAIAKAIEQGGFKHKSKNFANTVRSSLVRDETFVRRGKRWGLREWESKAATA